jgi:replicative DNA helicase
MGKTTFCLNAAEHAAVAEGKGVAIFSLEMSKQSLVQNMLCSRARVDAHRLRRGFLADEDWGRLSQAVGKLSEAPILIDDTPGLSPLLLRAKARRMKAKHDIQMIIIDYLQLMEVPQMSSRGDPNRQAEISYISRSLKGLARELSIPIIALSQLNRSVDSREDHRPRMSDLRESGAIEQDADVIMFLYRPEYYETDPDKKAELAGQAECIVGKQRNGPTGTVNLAFLAQFMRFESAARDKY